MQLSEKNARRIVEALWNVLESKDMNSWEYLFYRAIRQIYRPLSWEVVCRL